MNFLGISQDYRITNLQQYVGYIQKDRYDQNYFQSRFAGDMHAFLFMCLSVFSWAFLGFYSACVGI